MRENDSSSDKAGHRSREVAQSYDCIFTDFTFSNYFFLNFIWYSISLNQPNKRKIFSAIFRQELNKQYFPLNYLAGYLGIKDLDHCGGALGVRLLAMFRGRCPAHCAGT